MAKMNGCNDGMAGPSGSNSTRHQPQNHGRANLAKGGVNKHQGGTDKPSKAPGKAGSVGQGKHHQMPKPY